MMYYATLISGVRSSDRQHEVLKSWCIFFEWQKLVSRRFAILYDNGKGHGREVSLKRNGLCI